MYSYCSNDSWCCWRKYALLENTIASAVAYKEFDFSDADTQYIRYET